MRLYPASFSDITYFPNSGFVHDYTVLNIVEF